MNPALAVEPTGRDDEWTHRVRRLDDDLVVGLFRTPERAQAFADNGGEPLPTARPEAPDTDAQLDMFGAAA